MLDAEIFENRCQVTFIFSSSIRPEVLYQEIGFGLDLLDEMSIFSTYSSRGLVRDGDRPTPMCKFIKKREDI